MERADIGVCAAEGAAGELGDIRFGQVQEVEELKRLAGVNRVYAVEWVSVEFRPTVRLGMRPLMKRVLSRRVIQKADEWSNGPWTQ